MKDFGIDRFAYLEGARMVNPCRVLSYKVIYADGTSKMEKFSQIQADAYGTVLETDGIGIEAAVRMVDLWNLRAKSQGNTLRYKIPFVNN